MKLLIIRHGDPDYAIDSLTEKGWREAELLSQRLVKLNIDDFYCSPLGRAKDTAKPTMAKINGKIEILSWLAEFAGVISSPYTNKNRIPWDLAPTLWADEADFYDRNRWTNPSLIASGNVKEVYDQTTLGLSELLRKYGWSRNGMLYRCDAESDRTIALFCHCGMGLTIISYLTGTSPFLLWHNFFLPTSSVSTIVTETDRNGNAHFRCVQIGDTSHLYAAGEDISQAGLYPEFEK